MESQAKQNGVKRKTPSRKAKSTTTTSTSTTSASTSRTAPKKRQKNSQERPRSVKARLSSTCSLSSLEDEVFEMAGDKEKEDHEPITLSALRLELDAQTARIESNNAKTIAEMNTKIEATTNAIGAERRERKEDIATLRGEIKLMTASIQANNFVGTNPRTNAREEHEYKNYWRSRSILNFSPIKGEVRDEMIKSLQTFLFDLMLIPPEDISQENIIDIRRVRLTRNAKTMLECTVVFSSVEVRDFVAAHAKNLASIRVTGSEPTPSVSVRMDVPQHLRGIKRELDEYGFLLKTETKNLSGKSELKRSVKYDDAERTLHMDVLYPGKTKWAKITYEQAREGNRLSQSRFATNVRTRHYSTDRPVEMETEEAAVPKNPYFHLKQPTLQPPPRSSRSQWSFPS